MLWLSFSFLRHLLPDALTKPLVAFRALAHCCQGRYAQFQVWADEAAIGDSIAGVPQRAYSAPASKYTQAMHDALPEWARPMLDWEMPLYEEDEPGLSPLPPRGPNARL
jgi:hypothetical protein